MFGGESKALFSSRERRIVDWLHSALWSWAVHSLFDRTQQSQMVTRGLSWWTILASSHEQQSPGMSVSREDVSTAGLPPACP